MERIQATTYLPCDLWDYFQKGIALPGHVDRHRAVAAALLLFLASDDQVQETWLRQADEMINLRTKAARDWAAMVQKRLEEVQQTRPDRRRRGR